MTPDANVQRMADTVLVVEDDHSVRALLRMLLEDEGLDVLAAASGPEAVELFGNAHVDLVLLDIRLPGFDGFEVCRRIRRLSNVPIIMVTAQQDSHDVVAGLELGADDYVTKPFNDRELMARVRTQLRRLQLSSAADSDIIRVGPGDPGRGGHGHQGRRAAVADQDRVPVAGPPGPQPQPRVVEGAVAGACVGVRLPR